MPYATVDDDITGFGFENEFSHKLKIGIEAGPPWQQGVPLKDGCKASVVAGGLELTTPLTVGVYR